MSRIGHMGSYERAEMWIACGARWGSNAHPLLLLNIQMLGHAERPILELEEALKNRSPEATIETAMVLTECSALSVFWLFGLYEALRTLRQRDPLRFEPLTEIFKEVELARMPLAKHEVKGTKKYRGVDHYPTSVWDIESGWVGWQVFDPEIEQMVVIYRSSVADRFLRHDVKV
jgi:hypothetical protein